MRQKNQIYSKISQFVTVRGKYNESMRNCLLSASASGAFWLIFLFVACFLGVHTVRLAKIGWKYRKGESAEDKKSGSAESVQKMFELPYNHKPRVIKGLMADECSSVLSDFFRQLRERKKALSNKKNGKI